MIGRAMSAGTAVTRSGTGRQPASAVANGDGPQLSGDIPMDSPTDQQAVTVAQEKLPTRCDGKEQYAFEAWAAAERYDMNEHPLHYLFLNEKTAAARKGWAAGLKYASDIAARLSVSSASAEGIPDIGADPMKGDRLNRIEQAIATCREAYVRQQKGVPDQTALVWRWHLGALLEYATRLEAMQSRAASPNASTPPATDVSEPAIGEGDS